MDHAARLRGNAAKERARGVLLRQQGGRLSAPESFTILINQFKEDGQPDTAAYWFKRMLECGLPASKAHYRSMVEAHLRVSDFEKARAWVDRMRLDGFEIDVVTYGKIVSAAASRGDIDIAERLVEEAAGLRLLPKVYEVLANALADADEIHRAEKYLRQTQTAAGPAPSAFSHLLAAAARLGDVERAVSYFEELRTWQLPQAHDWCSLLHALGSLLPKGRRRLADTAQEMAATGCLPDEPTADLICRVLGEPFLDRIRRVASTRAVEMEAIEQENKARAKEERLERWLHKPQGFTCPPSPF